jgi:GTP-binding protein
LHPNLGVVGVDNAEFVMADIPGLIAGAHEGKGIGDRFLGHVERCAVLLHLIDGTSEDVVGDYDVIIHELEEYGGHLADKPRVTALNKIDALDEIERAEKHNALEQHIGGKVYQISGVSHEGLTEVLRAVRAEIVARNKAEAVGELEAETWRP